MRIGDNSRERLSIFFARPGAGVEAERIDLGTRHLPQPQDARLKDGSAETSANSVDPLAERLKDEKFDLKTASLAFRGF